MILRPPFKVSHGHSRLQSVFLSYLNCPILVASGLHNGSIQAFLTRRFREERKAECSPSLSADPHFFVSYLLLVFLCRVVSKSSSQLLTPPSQPARSDVKSEASIPLSPPLPLRPQFEPMYHTAGHHRTVEQAQGQLLFVCTIYVGVQSAANGSVMQSFTLAVPSMLLSIRLMMFGVRPRVPWLLKSRMWEVGCKEGGNGWGGMA